MSRRGGWRGGLRLPERPPTRRCCRTSRAGSRQSCRWRAGAGEATGVGWAVLPGSRPGPPGDQASWLPETLYLAGLPMGLPRCNSPSRLRPLLPRAGPPASCIHCQPPRRRLEGNRTVEMVPCHADLAYFLCHVPAGRACLFTTLIRVAGWRLPAEDDFALGKSWFGLAGRQDRARWVHQRARLRRQAADP